MDRSCFLSALPFLIPLQSHAWPPVRTSGGDGDARHVDSATRVILGQVDKYNRSFFLSIEPVRDQSDGEGGNNKEEKVYKSLGPAYFSRKTDEETDEETDEAVTSIEIAIEENDLLHEGNSNQCLPTSRKSLTSKAMSIVYLRLSHCVYALDISRLKECIIDPEVYAAEYGKNGGENEESENYSHSKPLERPPSLICRFDSAVFRIFSLRNKTANRTSSNFCSSNDVFEEKETLSSIRDYFSAIFTKFSQKDQEKRLHALIESDIISPCRSSTGTSSSSSLAAGQLASDSIAKMKPPANEAVVSRKRGGNDATDEKAEDTNSSTFLSRIKRRKAAHLKLQENLSAIEKILDMPQSIVAQALNLDSVDSSDVLPETKLSPLLNVNSELLHSSYAPSTDLNAAIGHYQSMLQKNHHEMEKCINALFPLPQRVVNSSSKHRTRTLPNSVAQKNETVELKDVDNLLKRQREIIHLRHKLFLLPTRG